MKISKLQLLNVLTGVLHTTVDDLYTFFNEGIEDGIMTHHLPNAYKAIKPILIRRYPDLPHEGHHPNIENGGEMLELTFTDDEKKEFWSNFQAQPSLLAGKNVIIAKVQ